MKFSKFCLRQQLLPFKEFCMEKRLSNIFKTTNVRKLIKAILKFYKLHLKKGDQKVRLVFKDHWISSCFYYLNLHFGEKCETKLLRKPTEVSQNPPTSISIGLPDAKKRYNIYCAFWLLFYFKKKLLRFSIFHISSICNIWKTKV